MQDMREPRQTIISGSFSCIGADFSKEVHSRQEGDGITGGKVCSGRQSCCERKRLAEETEVGGTGERFLYHRNLPPCDIHTLAVTRARG